MQKKIVVANWKSFNDPKKSQDWFNQINNLAADIDPVKIPQIILCVPFINLPTLKEEMAKMNKLNISLSTQNISPFEEGAYTGEISASMIKELVNFTMIGHSERRTHFKEDAEMINRKIAQAQNNKLQTIVCVSLIEEAQFITKEFPGFPDIILYEPLFAIGTGKADSPENAGEAILKIKHILPQAQIIYGGSVQAGNVVGFISREDIDGVAIGKASLDPASFIEIIKNVSAN